MLHKRHATSWLMIGVLTACIAACGNEEFAAPEQEDDSARDRARTESSAVEDQARETGRRVGELYKSEAESDYELPSAQSTDEAGKALLSWRVHLLPFLGHRNLYNRFNLNEPWDSPHNKKLIPQMPKIYQTDRTLPQGKTTAVALVSDDSAITPGGGIRFANITDGASNTILFVIADRECAVTWTKPGDIKFDPQKPLRCLGKAGFFQALFCDGSVHRIPRNIDPETMRRLVNRRDGKTVSLAF